MARITAQNYQSYMKGSNRHIDTHTREMYLGDSPTVQAGYGTYDSTETAHKVACYMFSLDDSATATTPCTDIPRGFTVAVETDNSVIEYQYKKPMPVAGYTAADLEVKSIANVDASDVSYDNSDVGTALLGIEEDVHNLKGDVGTVSGLDTISKQDLVGAVNEVNTKANNANTKIGTLTSLHTTDKTTVVDAINEVKDAIPTSMSAENVTYSSSGSHTIGSIAEAVASAEESIQSLDGEVYNINESISGLTNSTEGLRSDVGNLSNLDTPAQNLVSAINSGITSASNSATAAAASSATAQQASTSAVNAAQSVLDELDNFPASQDATVLQHGTRITALESTSVHDLSVMYSSSYASLSAALTALNADTNASAIKVGGMSIKFINSTTNKYEQWNLKASSWSINLDDWALDVDGSITNGKLKLSHELVKPSSNEYVTQSSQIGHNGEPLDDILDKTAATINPDANTDALYITDNSGNILAEFSSQGLNVVDVKTKVSGRLVSLVTQLGNKVDKVTGKGLSTNDYTNAEKDKLSSLKTFTDIDEEANTDILYVRDNSGNVIFKIDSDGVHATAFLCHLNGNIYNILSLINSLENGVVKVTSQTFTDEEKAIARNNIGALDADSVSESITDTFYVVDSNANIIFKIDDKGVHTTRVTLDELVSDGNFSIVDNAGNIGLRLKANGETDLVLSQESINHIISELLNVGNELSAIIPTDLYRVTNMLYHKREYAPKLMAERMQTGEKYVGYASGSPEWLVANKQLSVFNGNYQDAEVGNTLVQDVFTKKTFSLNLHTSKNTVFQDKKLNFLPLGDSITNHNNWHTYLRKLLLMDNVDWQIANDSDAVKYDMQTLGIKWSPSNVAFTYRDKSVNVKYNYNEGRPSWAAATYLRHADVYTYSAVSYNGVSKSILHVAWRILGLYEKYNQDYDGSRQQKEYIRTTCNGQYAITTSCIDGWVWNCYREKINLSSVEYSSATSEQKEAMITYFTTTLLDNPTNPFFSKDKVLETKDSNNCYAFDWATYYARYKTHDENGNVLATQGPKAIGKNMHVCIPNVIGICLGTNDEAYNSADTTVNEQDAYKIAELLQQATNAVVIIFANGVPQSRFPEKYGLAGIQATNNYVARYQTKNHQLEEICGNWNNQVSKNIFYAPCYYIQTFGNYEDYPLTELYTEENIGSVLTSADIHPNNLATSQWSYQIYSLMAYLISKGIL